MLSQYIYKLIPQHKYKQIYKKKKKKIKLHSDLTNLYYKCLF